MAVVAVPLVRRDDGMPPVGVVGWEREATRLATLDVARAAVMMCPDVIVVPVAVEVAIDAVSAASSSVEFPISQDPSLVCVLNSLGSELRTRDSIGSVWVYMGRMIQCCVWIWT